MKEAVTGWMASVFSPITGYKSIRGYIYRFYGRGYFFESEVLFFRSEILFGSEVLFWVRGTFLGRRYFFGSGASHTHSFNINKIKFLYEIQWNYNFWPLPPDPGPAQKKSFLCSGPWVMSYRSNHKSPQSINPVKSSSVTDTRTHGRSADNSVF
jgi:hypothetical protein